MTVSDTPPVVVACSVCGCTEETACPGGCAWADVEAPAPSPMCTTCAMLTFSIDAEHWFPFIETENADIAGPGHQDKAAFAAAVQRYDELATGEPSQDPYDVDAVDHRWARWTTTWDDGQFELCASTAAGAFPITTVWGVR